MAGLLNRLPCLSPPFPKGGPGRIHTVLILGLLFAIPTLADSPNASPIASLPDPTRPPAAFSAPPPDQAAPKLPEVVNAIYLAGKKPYALVDGVALHVGDPLGEGNVVRIDETGVWLKEPAGERVLRLLPGVEKTLSVPADPAGAGKQPKAGAPNAENKVRATPRARTRRSQ